jgi:hypothetical protein
VVRRCLVVAVSVLMCLAAPVAAEVVARVNGEEITREELGLALVHSLGRAAVDSMVDRILVEQAAGRNGIAVSDEELARRTALELELRMRAAAANARLTRGQFREAAERYGWDMDAVRREVEDSISPKALRSRLLAERLLEPRLDLDGPALEAYYERTRGLRYAAAHIELPSRESAVQMVRLLESSPGSWAEFVARYSLDRPSVAHRGRMAPVPAASGLGRVLAGMGADELGVFSEGDAWHVVRLLSEVPPEAGEFEEVADDLRTELRAVLAASREHELLAELHRAGQVVRNLSAVPEVRRLLGDDVAAYVNGEPMAVERLAEALIEQFGGPMLQGYIERTLVFQEARRRGIGVTSEEVQARLAEAAGQLLAQQASQRDMTPEEFKEFLLRSGVTTRDFAAMLARELLSAEDARATLLAERIAGAGVSVDESDIDRAYQELYSERLVVRDMAFGTASEAEFFLEDVLAGGDFDILARARASSPGGWMVGANLVSVAAGHPYYGRAAGLREGEASGVFKHESTYHIIRLVKRDPPRERPPLDQVRGAVEQEARLRRSRERIRAFLVKLRAEADIQVEMG